MKKLLIAGILALIPSLVFAQDCTKGQNVTFAQLPVTTINGTSCIVTDLVNPCTTGTVVTVGGGSRICQVGWYSGSWIVSSSIPTPVNVSNIALPIKTYNNTNLFSTIAAAAPQVGKLVALDWVPYTVSSSLNDTPPAEPPLVKLFDGTVQGSASPFGVCTANCTASTGSWAQPPPGTMIHPIVQYQGLYTGAVFDGNAAYNDYATWSTTVSGDFHDTGVIQSSTSVLTKANLGVIQTVNTAGAGGTASVMLNIPYPIVTNQVGKCIVGANQPIVTTGMTTICASWFPQMPFTTGDIGTSEVEIMGDGNYDILPGAALPGELSCIVSSQPCVTISGGICGTGGTVSDKHGNSNGAINTGVDKWIASTEFYHSQMPAPMVASMSGQTTGTVNMMSTLTKGFVQCEALTNGYSVQAVNASLGTINSEPLDGTQMTLIERQVITGSEL